MPIRKALQQLSSTMKDLRKPGGTTTSIANAKNWNASGGGYDKWKAGDAAREKALPIGSQVLNPKTRPSPMSGMKMASPMSFKKGGTVKKTGFAKVHKGEKITPAKSKTKKILQFVGHELKTNPPKVLAKTKKKSGAKQANRQRVAILLSKARRSGANVQPAQPPNDNDGDEQ